MNINNKIIHSKCCQASQKILSLRLLIVVKNNLAPLADSFAHIQHVILEKMQNDLLIG